MVKCKTCGTIHSLESDLCGNQCVSCVGTEYFESKWNGHAYVCYGCGCETKFLTNEVCPNCYNEWRNNSSSLDLKTYLDTKYHK